LIFGTAKAVLSALVGEL